MQSGELNPSSTFLTKFWKYRLPVSLEQQYRRDVLGSVNRWLRAGMVITTIAMWIAIGFGLMTTDIKLSLFIHYAGIMQGLLLTGFAISFTKERFRDSLLVFTPLFIGAFAFMYLTLITNHMPQKSWSGAHTTFIVALFTSYIFEKFDPLNALKGGILVTGLYLWFFYGKEMEGSTSVQRYFHLFAVNACGFLISCVSNRADRVRYLLEQELVWQRAQSEMVLNRILPESVARRIQAGETNVAEFIPDATVLFADIVGFTELASQMPARQVVQTLNDLFARFDLLAKEHGVSKIKTIGDAYMAAGGCPLPDHRHAEKIADFALAMQKCVQAFSSEFAMRIDIRIGIHSGSVVAGVIGFERFGYDLWGDTVNTASRMESTAKQGTIQVSEQTRDLLKRNFALSGPWTADVKGKGKMTTYALLGRRDQALANQSKAS